MEISGVDSRLTSTRPLRGEASAVVALSGEWDLSGRRPLSDILSRLIARRDTDVIVDLSKVTFIDTAIGARRRREP